MNKFLFPAIEAEKDIVSFNFMYIKLKAVNDFILFCHQKPINYVVSFMRLGSVPIVPSMVLLRKRA